MVHKRDKPIPPKKRIDMLKAGMQDYTPASSLLRPPPRQLRETPDHPLVIRPPRPLPNKQRARKPINPALGWRFGYLPPNPCRLSHAQPAERDQPTAQGGAPTRYTNPHLSEVARVRIARGQTYLRSSKFRHQYPEDSPKHPRNLGARK